MDDIIIRGAREHNLRGVNLVLPRNRLICFTGVSGSGKSSLAFDTLYAEGQRRYVESLSTFARQFLGQMPKPAVDQISGLSPSISIAQKSSGQNPRSTVGTITEIYDYLRVLYARAGTGHCPRCNRPITAQSREQIISAILQLPAGTSFLVLAPVIRAQKGEHRDLFAALQRQGYVRARVDGQVVRLADELRLVRNQRHDIEVVIDRLTASPAVRPRLAEAVEQALRLGDGSLIVSTEEAAAANKAEGPQAGRGTDQYFSARYACIECGLSFEPPTPQLFSFNSPLGMCPHCHGLGEAYDLNMALLVQDASKSLDEGCVVLLGPRRTWRRWLDTWLLSVAAYLAEPYGMRAEKVFSTPWQDLPAEIRQAILTGTGSRAIPLKRDLGRHRKGERLLFPGLVGFAEHMWPSMAIESDAERYFVMQTCRMCKGERLNEQARHVRLTSEHAACSAHPSLSLPEVCKLSVDQASEFFSALRLTEVQRLVTAELLKEVRGRLRFLQDVGLGYLTLARTAPTLSGGESQRIRLASQVGCGLVGVLYILDEPSIGLHHRDNERLLNTLCRLRDLGNTVVVVEHDEETMRAADLVVDFGPGPGVRGGEVVASGTADELAGNPKSLTGRFLSGKERIEVPAKRRQPGQAWLKVRGARHNNLKDLQVEIPLGLFVCVTGVSGSGKSSLVNGILLEALNRDLNGGNGTPGDHDGIDGLEHLDKLIAIDQSPIGRTPRSNPGTYVKVFDEIRRLYAQLPEARQRGYREGRFSFNVPGGRCEACEGNGSRRLEMDFLADVWVTCEVCEGRRFHRETLEVKFKEKSIADVLEMDVQQALAHFENVPRIRAMLQTLHDVGLDYIKIGQPSPTLSGGEAQRIKLARELVKRSTGRTLYVLDEPTTGLHFADIRLLLRVLHGFVQSGNTVVVVEHNLDVIKTADWIIDLGPEGGDEGGRIVAVGSPEEVARCPSSHTGRALAPLLGLAPRPAPPRTPPPDVASSNGCIRVQGAQQHNLKHVNVEIPRHRTTVCCGPSGSGKTSLAMDTIYAEGQRRYVESLSPYARQFVAQMQKPLLEHIEGLSPAIAIEQKHFGHTPRSTVGTVTEIYDYLRILYARLGQPYCPTCEQPVGTQTTDQIIDKIMALPPSQPFYLLAPLELDPAQEPQAVWETVRSSGYRRVRIDGRTRELENVPQLERRRQYQIEVVVDRLTLEQAARQRVADSVEHALELGRGVLRVALVDPRRPEEQWHVAAHSLHMACDRCGRSFDPLGPHHFSFNSSLGWCPGCQGLGVQKGANPAALLRSPQLTLAEGAVALFPTESPMFQGMLRALADYAGIPLDVPYDALAPRHRRVLLHGTGEAWIPVYSAAAADGVPLFRFQYKGLYPALEEAARLAPSFRYQLESLMGEVECTLCLGSRLRDDAAAVRLKGLSIHQLCCLPLGELLPCVKRWKFTGAERKVAGDLVREVLNRVQFLVDVGLDYLTLARPTPTLSGGEAQRIRLASQVGSGLTGVLYVLDEPTIGLHPRDNQRLLRALRQLRNLGNTLLIVEHDREVVAAADHLLDFGPGAGDHGGQIVAQGSPAEVAAQDHSATGPYLAGRKAIPVPAQRRMPSGLGENSTAHLPPGGGWLTVQGARHNNLQNVSAAIPLGTFTVVTGVSGSGKSSLVNDVLYQALAHRLHRASTTPGAHDKIEGLQFINKVICVDQQPLGNAPTSNPATYTGAFDLIRQLYARLPEARLRGYTPRTFSFNVAGGRCEKCEGNGQLKIEMHFLPDVWVRCEDCQGRRYTAETLQVRFHGQSISDVLEMPVDRALELFVNVPAIHRILQTLSDVGLGYLRLGQPAHTLSGGEAQRVKLAAELARPDTGRTLYVLDEPTTGLHFSDLERLLDVLHRLVELGNTVLVIEHNLDVIKTADWVIDLGPEAGAAGGRIVAAGTPEDVASYAQQLLRKGKASDRKAANGLARSYTGELLGPVLEAGPRRERTRATPASAASGSAASGTGRPGAGVAHSRASGRDAPGAAAVPAPPAARRSGKADPLADTAAAQLEIREHVPQPWEVDGRAWHTQQRVAHNGRTVKWEGQALAAVVDRIQQQGGFAPTNWNARSIVEIAAQQQASTWFFHALTGDEWLLALRFRVPARTFSRQQLLDELHLPSPSETPYLPLYGSQPRIQLVSRPGQWLEIELRVHNLAEIDRPAFWKFIEQAAAAFQARLAKQAEEPAKFAPWTKLGKAWHCSTKGFTPGKKVLWPQTTLTNLVATLERVAPDAVFRWSERDRVLVSQPDSTRPWAVLHTKRWQYLQFWLYAPPGRISLGRVSDLAPSVEVKQARAFQVIKLRFNEPHQTASPAFEAFLREFLEDVRVAARAS